MNSNQLDPQKALNPAYKKFTPLKKDVDDFAKELEKCIISEKDQFLPELKNAKKVW